jgi:hypothetical protein
LASCIITLSGKGASNESPAPDNIGLRGFDNILDTATSGGVSKNGDGSAPPVYAAAFRPDKPLVLPI